MINGVGYLHEKNLLHRDLKPANTLVDKDNKLIVCDFGLAKKLEKGQKTSGRAGTPSYWAPEVVGKDGQKSNYDHSADWWSIGIIFYELMYQRKPFDSDPENKEGLDTKTWNK